MHKYLKFIALSLLAAAILWWFGRGLDWAGVREAVGKCDWRLIALALFVISSTYLWRAYRWQVLLAPLAPAGLHELFAATTVGIAYVQRIYVTPGSPTDNYLTAFSGCLGILYISY